MDVFFSDDDRQRYVQYLAKQGRINGLTICAWCLMTNHLHLVAVPATADALSKALGEAHKRYVYGVNRREGWTGYLFQGRFFSCPVEPSRLLGVVRYVLRNPVRAGIVQKAWEHPWSSARWMVGDVATDPLVSELGPLTEIDDWRTFLSDERDSETIAIRKHTRTGRPLGTELFRRHVELVTERELGS